MERKVKGPVVLVVLDGWGLDASTEHNGVALAATPHFDRLSSTYPFTTLQASGEHVGLPEGQIGNSEVGHTTIGAGTVIYQDLVRISKDAESGVFCDIPAFRDAFDATLRNDSQLHIMGLVSPGGVHSHENHFFEIIRAAAKAGIKKIVLHPFLDGRDYDRTEGAKSLERLEALINELGVGRIATVIGRYYAMDRDKNWARTDKAAAAIFDGIAAPSDTFQTNSPSTRIKELYDGEMFDEMIEPHVIKDSDGGVAKINAGDAIIFTNFRTDRTRQLSARICEKVKSINLTFVTMTDYGNEVESIKAYEPVSIEQTLAGVIAEAGMNQAHLAETEKFAHATYFLNGGKEDAHGLEEHVLIPSNKDVKTHDEKPEMKAKEICDAAIERLDTNDFLFINFANPDMVGHTANQSAIIKAVETVDTELGRLVDAVFAADGALIVIADHGNAEEMVDKKTNMPHTAHTTNPVPCILIGDNVANITLKPDMGLKDVAPTVLELLGLEKSSSMTGESIIKPN